MYQKATNKIAAFSGEIGYIGTSLRDMTLRQTFATVLILIATGVFTGCAPQETPEERRRAANTAAGKLGQVAHKAATEADKAGKVIGRQLKQAAHDAHEGWKEDARKDQSKK